MTEERERNTSRTILYLTNSERWGKVTPALSRHFSIIGGNPSTGKNATRSRKWLKMSITKSPVLLRLAELRSLPRLPATYFALRKLRRENELLIVMVNGFTTFDLALGLIAKMLGLPFLVRLRGGMWREVADYWQFQLFPLKQIYIMEYRFRRNRVLSLADGIIPVSHFLKNQIIHSTDIDINKIKTVYNPVDITAFDDARKGEFRKKVGIKEDQKIILTVTGFHFYKKYKGIFHYLPAMLQVLNENPKWVFVIAGGGYSFETARAQIMAKVPEQLASRILFVGHYEPIQEVFADADIVVHFSFRESAGQIVLEAQAARKPIIVNDFGGPPELLQQQHDGFVSVVYELTQLYESLTTLVINRDLRQLLCDENRKAVEVMFNIDTISSQFHGCIGSLVDQ